ncbi:MAG: Asp-tRNA(Asn)/Glu-tRNA(Gln) amidotransferase subunit GatA [Phycisphaerales bacterium]|nr:Asp-tRNA(Asn)/Glu-tRNA(Gln) amidotransferase subunit GatA [Phycisphaerales bacterium]
MTASATQIAADVRARRVSAAQVCRDALARIDAANPRLNAFLQVFHDRALEQARAIDARMARGEDPGPLAGVPVALKDNICLEWGRTTAGSRMLENYESPFSATAARRLIDAGAVIVGKTNLDEFGMGSSGENSAFGPTRNPHDESRVPGGSSSGSAAAVAAGLVPVALGSDTGGSIRQPAGWCGIVGVKPTYGRVSRYGLIAYASSLDQIGVLAGMVDDAALALSVIAGPDPLDATSARRELEEFTHDPSTPPPSLVIGVPRQARAASHHAAVTAALDSAINAYKVVGARIVDVDLPHTDHALAAYYLVAAAEASSNLARYDGIRYGRRSSPAREGEAGEVPESSRAEGGLLDLYCRSRSEGLGPEVQRRIMLGTYALSAGYYDAYYLTALRARRLVKTDFDAAWAAGCHALLLPTSPGPAFRLGERADPIAMYLEDVYTVGVNLAGLPAVALPGGRAGEAGSRLPVGLQLVGPAWQESSLLRAARLLEAANPVPRTATSAPASS